jgi:hypothetical protein
VIFIYKQKKMALIKRINQFNLDSNLTGNELILTMDDGITKNMMLDNVKDFILNNDNDLTDLGFITSPNTITQDITLPEDSNVYYYGDLSIASGYTLTIPSGTTLTIIDANQVTTTVTGGTYNNGVATFTSSDDSSFDVLGFYTGSTSLSEYGFITTPAEINQDITLPEDSIVYYYGDLKIGSGYTLTIPSGTTLELIDVNTAFITGDTNNNSVLIGGVDNIIDPLAYNTVIIGGVDITGNSSNTVYVPSLNINNLTTGGALNNLAIDSNGNVVISDLYSLSDLGFNITSRPSTVIHQNIVLPENTDVTYTSPLTMDINNTIIVPIDTILTII